MEAVMAKKKRPGGRKPIPSPRSAVINIRSRPEWKEWLSGFAEHVRKDVPDVVDEALLRYAKAEGYQLPPKR